MTDSNETLRTALRAAQARAESGRVPDFDSTWSAAEARVGVIRRRYGALAASVVVATVAAVAIGLLLPSENEWQFIDTGELLGTTSWTAPSDSLLPEHRFDIYQDMPLLMESTETDGGALL